MLTYRSDEVSPELRHYLAELDREHLAQDFSLKQLDRADVDAMLGAIFAMHQAMHTGLVESMYALTEGNPFFIEEMLKSLIATGEIASTDGVWERTLLFGTHTRHPSIPRSVQDAVYQRTKQLSAPARQVLRLSAVAGRRFDLAILQQVMHADESHMLVLMKELVAAQFVTEEAADQFSFRHALTRQAVYSELLAGERRALHRTIAETIEQHALPSSILDAQLVDLASHFYEGEIWSKAVEYGQRAGERALVLYAPRAAIEHLTRALDALKHLGSTPTAALLRARGQAYETVGEFERARADYEQTLSIAQQTQDGLMEWQSLLDIGFWWVGRDYAQAGDWFRRSLERAQVQESLRIATEIKHMQWMTAAHFTLGHVYLLLLEANLAVQALEAGLALANDIGSAWWVGNITAYLARAYLLQGALPRAEAALKAGMARSKPPANAPERRMSWAWGELALASEEPEMALDIAEQLLASAPGVTRSQPIPWLLKLKGEALGALSRREEAIQALEKATQGALARQEQPLLWQIHRALGRQHQHLKQEDLAQRNFSLARQVIASLASTIDDAYLHEHFLHAALATLPREKLLSANRVAKAAFGGLTEREREIVRMEGFTLARLNLEPGWRWSECIKPVAHTDSCQVSHVGYAVAGRLIVRLQDGTQQTIVAGDAYTIPPGHDAWVEGDEPFVGIEVMSAERLARP